MKDSESQHKHRAESLNVWVLESSVGLLERRNDDFFFLPKNSIVKYDFYFYNLSLYINYILEIIEFTFCSTSGDMEPITCPVSQFLVLLRPSLPPPPYLSPSCWMWSFATVALRSDLKCFNVSPHSVPSCVC